MVTAWVPTAETGRQAGGRCLAVEVDSAGGALADTASVFGAFQIQDIAQDPQQWHVTRYIDRAGMPVHVQFKGHRFRSVHKYISKRLWRIGSSGQIFGLGGRIQYIRDGPGRVRRLSGGERAGPGMGQAALVTLEMPEEGGD